MIFMDATKKKQKKKIYLFTSRQRTRLNNNNFKNNWSAPNPKASVIHRTIRCKELPIHDSYNHRLPALHHL